MRGGLAHIPQDIRRYGPPLGIIAVYAFVMNVVFGMTVCPVSLVTGFPCPACGITRAAVLFSRGEFAMAFEMHPFFYGVLAMGALAAFLRYVLNKNIAWMQYLAAVAGIFAIAFYIYRMAVYFPDQAPMCFESRSLFGLLSSRL